MHFRYPCYVPRVPYYILRAELTIRVSKVWCSNTGLRPDILLLIVVVRIPSDQILVQDLYPSKASGHYMYHQF
jgi:hypothetical protein